MYIIKTHKFHELLVYNTITEKTIGPFNRFEKPQLETLVHLLNQKNNTLTPIETICQKYRIPIEDLPGVLDEYIVRDNDGYQGYSMCEDCKKTCKDHIPDCENYTSQY